MNSLYIKGRKYKLKVMSIIDNDETIVGRCYKKDHVIKIVKDESMEESLKTLIHELLHAYIYECGLYTDSNDEDLVRYFELNFLPFLITFLKATEIVYSNKKKDIERIKHLICKLFDVNCKDFQ